MYHCKKSTEMKRTLLVLGDLDARQVASRPTLFLIKRFRQWEIKDLVLILAPSHVMSSSREEQHRRTSSLQSIQPQPHDAEHLPRVGRRE